MSRFSYQNVDTRIVLLCLVVFTICSCKGKQQQQRTIANSTPTEQNKSKTPVNDKMEKYILFFGNSLTAGYGLEKEEEQAFPAIIQRRLDSLGLNYVAINAGLSGETTAGGNGRIDWVLQQRVDVFVLELGANDALRGIDVKSTRENLKAIIDKVKVKYPDIPVIIAGMLAPPNMGTDYTAEFQSIFSDLAKEYDAGLIPFLLEGVAAIPELNQRDGIHPNAVGARIVADNVWAVLKDYL